MIKWADVGSYLYRLDGFPSNFVVDYEANVRSNLLQHGSAKKRGYS